jgi:uncharacterized membrane protein YkoI
MKITRLLALSMLILTLTLVIASCDVARAHEASVTREAGYQFHQLRDRIEHHSRAESAEGPEPSAHPAGETVTQPAARKGEQFPEGTVALTREDAEAIVLAHAGVSAEDTLRLYTEADREDGMPVYEVEFHVAASDGEGYLEYEYTVHADSGKILEFETELEKAR